MRVAEYIAASRSNINRLSLLSGLTYGTLHAHVKHGEPLGLEAAKKLEAATRGAINATEVLGLCPPPCPRCARRHHRRARARRAARKAAS